MYSEFAPLEDTCMETYLMCDGKTQQNSESYLQYMQPEEVEVLFESIEAMRALVRRYNGIIALLVAFEEGWIVDVSEDLKFKMGAFYLHLFGFYDFGRGKC